MSDNTQNVENKEPKIEPTANNDLEVLTKRLKEVETKNREYQTLIKQEQESKLKSQQEWKQLAELKEKEALEATERESRLKQSYLSEKKLSAIKEHAAKLGLLPEAAKDLPILDLDEVQVEATTMGNINILGADKFAQKLKTIRPHWFSTQAPVVNGGAGRVVDPAAPTTLKEVMAAEAEARKTGDYTKYRELALKYKKQS